jgi:tRNA threonylcarbamoyladenosine biosynthesis protein TsaE
MMLGKSDSVRGEHNRMRQLLISTSSPEETEAVGRALGEAAFPGAVICLAGPLGAGKTVLAQGIARGLGVEEPATSPTFVYVRSHHGRLLFYHVDLYRIERPEEVETLGLEDILSGAVVVAIEWPEHAAAWLPDERLEVTIEFAENGRAITLSATDAAHMALVARAAGG